MAKSHEEFKRIAYNDGLFLANTSTAAAHQHFQLQIAQEFQPMLMVMLEAGLGCNGTITKAKSVGSGILYK